MQHTPWKKSRTYGDNYGGAKGHRDEDNIRARLHSFRRPGAFEETPIIRVDNPSRDWFHPLNAEHVRYALEALPADDQGDVTHIWLRRGASRHFGRRYCPADSIWGSGVALVVLYPVRGSLLRDHGAIKPSPACQRIYQRYGAKLRRRGRQWQTHWTMEGIRKFYLQEALYSSVASHSAYTWRDGRSNSQKAELERMEDWLFRRRTIAEGVYRDLFG